MELNYKEDLYIDHNALDVEWLNQPQLMAAYTQAKADADLRVRELEEQKKTLRSELMLYAYENESICFAGKATDKKVEAWYREQKEYQKVIKDLNQAVHEAEVLDGAVRGLAHKKTALENLVMLAQREYFSTPSIPRDLNEEREKVKKEGREKVKKKIKRGRTK